MLSKSKKLFAVFVFAVFLFPFTASALVFTFDGYRTLTADWTGYAIDNAADGLGCPLTTNTWQIVATVGASDYFSAQVPVAQTLSSFTMSFPAGTIVNTANLYCADPIFGGSSSPTTIDNFLIADTPFQIISTPQSTALISNVSSGVTSTGSTLWVIVALAVSIPLTFYVIHSVMALFPKRKR